MLMTVPIGRCDPQNDLAGLETQRSRPVRASETLLSLYFVFTG